MVDLTRVLVISDTQAPFHHKDTIPFLKEIKKHLKPTHVIHIGDLEDFNHLNFHQKDPEMPSATDELRMLRAFVRELACLFPFMQIVDSNHGALPIRKAASIGIPKELLKDERSILQAPTTWTWHRELVYKLPNGIKVKFKHNFSSNLLNDSYKQGMSLVCGHLHTKSNIQWWQNDLGKNFAMQTGCLIDADHRVFNYDKQNSARPVISAGFILNGTPMLIPMHLSKNKRWVGFL